MMKRGIAMLAGLWLVLAAGGAVADEQRVLSLSDCLRIGLSHSARIRAAESDQGIAGASIDQARSLALPNLKGAAAYTRLDEVQDFEFDGDTFALGSLDNYSVETTVSQLLYSGGKVRSALRAAHAARSRADLGRRREELVLTRDIRVQFNAVLVAAETVHVREQALAQFTGLVEQTREKFENGTASEFDLITAQVRRQNEEPKWVAARNRHEIAVATMLRLLGLDDGAAGFAGELAFEEWRPDLDTLKARAMARHPLLLELRALIELRREDVQAARSGGLPELSASATYVGANSYRYAAFQDNWGWHWNAGVSLSWDIWNGGLTTALVREKRLVLEKTLIQFEDLQREVLLEVTSAYRDLVNAAEIVAAGRGNVALATRAADIARERHEAGLATYLEFTDATLALSEARLSELMAVQAYRDAVARLEYAAAVGEE